MASRARNLQARGNKRQAKMTIEDSDFKVSDDEENTQESAETVHALLQAVEKQQKETSRGSAFGKKLQALGDAADGQVLAVQEEARAMLDAAVEELKRMEAEDVDADWEEIATMFGRRSESMNEVFDLYDNILGFIGPSRVASIQNCAACLEENKQGRHESRKRLKKKAQGYLQEGMEKQKLATDARALIKGYKALLRL